jgi:hypothetical protein
VAVRLSHRQARFLEESGHQLDAFAVYNGEARQKRGVFCARAIKAQQAEKSSRGINAAQYALSESGDNARQPASTSSQENDHVRRFLRVDQKQWQP